MDLLTDLSELKVGDQLLRLSLITAIPVVVSHIENSVVSVTPRPENKEADIEYMSLGMMIYGVHEMSPVYLLNLVVWNYDMQTGEEIDPPPGLASMLVK
jgi:hypothetical protein